MSECPFCGNDLQVKYEFEGHKGWRHNGPEKIFAFCPTTSCMDHIVLPPMSRYRALEILNRRMTPADRRNKNLQEEIDQLNRELTNDREVEIREIEK
jgi:hypothetical protein